MAQSNGFIHSDLLESPIEIEQDCMAVIESPTRWLTGPVVDALAFHVANRFLELTVDNPGTFSLLPSRVLAEFMEKISSSSTVSRRSRLPIHLAPSEYEQFHSRKYVFMIANVNGNHWVLVLLHSLTDLAHYVNGRPTAPNGFAVVIFDSLKSKRLKDREFGIIQMLELRILPRLGLGYQELKNVPFFYPEVLQQKDTHSCGLYPAHFLRIFLREPEKYLDHVTGKALIPGPVEEIWGGFRQEFMRESAQEVLRSAIRLQEAFRTDFNLAPRSYRTLQEVGSQNKQRTITRRLQETYPPDEELDVTLVEPPLNELCAKLPKPAV